MSATSSRNSVPPCARSKVPILRGAPSLLAFAAEQLDLQPVGPHRRAVDRDERPLGAARARVQQAADDLLAGARRAGDQHPAAGRRHPLDLLPQLVDRRRRADQVELAAGAQPQFGIFAPQLRRLDRARDDQQQAVGS